MLSTKYHYHTTTCKITVQFILITAFLDSTQDEKKSELRKYKHSSNIIISHGMKFWFVLIPKLATIY
jgi:hypothetical protein